MKCVCVYARIYIYILQVTTKFLLVKQTNNVVADTMGSLMHLDAPSTFLRSPKGANHPRDGRTKQIGPRCELHEGTREQQAES